jgi:hypothetical protein
LALPLQPVLLLVILEAPPVVLKLLIKSPDEHAKEKVGPQKGACAFALSMETILAKKTKLNIILAYIFDNKEVAYWFFI